ncbi:MAG: hypothetical protein CL393_03010 [Acidiferrobacteraceae bacterium]|nr:hypothetical protein [Acidiferrobacteraceae bacterium]
MPASLNNYALLVFLGAVWGASFVAIKFCNILFNPIEVGFYRTFLAAIFLLLVVKLRKGKYDFYGKNTFTYSIIGLFNAAIPFTLIPYGLLALPSNIGVIIMSANPFLALVLAHFFTNDEKLNLRKTIGSIIGFSGVIFAVGVEVFVTDMDSLIGALAIYLSGCSYVVSNLIIRKISDQPSDMVTMNSLLWGSIWLLPLMFMYGNFSNYEFSSLPVLALIYLGIIPTGLAFSLRQVLIRNTGSTFMMQAAYLIPIFGIFYGWLLLGEPLKFSLFIGVIFVIVGIAISRMQVEVETKY